MCVCASLSLLPLRAPFAIIKLQSHKQEGDGDYKIYRGALSAEGQEFTPRSGGVSKRGGGQHGGRPAEGVRGSV